MVKEPINKDRWVIAQEEEKLHHIHESTEDSLNKWKDIYDFYFRYLEINLDLNNKTILEIGPARVSALLYCNNYGPSFIVEPTKYDDTEHLYINKDITFIRDLYEDCESPIVDEIWLFNVLQHIQNPDLFIDKCKKSAKIIKFFDSLKYSINYY